MTVMYTKPITWTVTRSGGTRHQLRLVSKQLETRKSAPLIWENNRKKFFKIYLTHQKRCGIVTTHQKWCEHFLLSQEVNSVIWHSTVGDWRINPTQTGFSPKRVITWTRGLWESKGGVKPVESWKNPQKCESGCTIKNLWTSYQRHAYKCFTCNLHGLPIQYVYTNMIVERL